MSYEKQTWETGQVITAEKLNHMEDGIEGGGVEVSKIFVMDCSGGIYSMGDGGINVYAFHGSGQCNWADVIGEKTIIGFYATVTDSGNTKPTMAVDVNNGGMKSFISLTKEEMAQYSGASVNALYSGGTAGSGTLHLYAICI